MTSKGKSRFDDTNKEEKKEDSVGPIMAQHQQQASSRSAAMNGNNNNSSHHHHDLESLEYSSQAESHVESDSYIDIHTLGQESLSVGGNYAAHFHPSHEDATETVHEMHLALLYLLSNPEEFQKALASRPPRGATTLMEWNNEYLEDTESMTDAGSAFGTSASDALNNNNIVNNNSNHADDRGSSGISVGNTVTTAGGGGTPLPFVVFADDAEVVLPQAHTASQLFGVERIEGIELEAAAGIPAISQLFLRWLALMPGGDHLNIIDPPGLTVMRIAGGRYRVTAAHRVVWTWNNQFAPLSTSSTSSSDSMNAKDEAFNQLQIGDLVTMTVVDVFETDNQGKLLSYCPTFDNRAIYKTNHTTETIRKSSGRLFTALDKAQKSKLARLVVKNAKIMAQSVKQRVGEAVNNYGSPSRNGSGGNVGSYQGSLSPHDFKLCNSSELDEMEKHEV